MSEIPIEVLVSAGSKHGSTAEIGERIASVLERRGLSVTVIPPEHALDLSDYGAVVLGSAVYAGHWVPAAKELANLVSAENPRPAAWLFSSGPVGEPPKPEEEPVDVAEVFMATHAREHRVFAGKIDKSKLNFGEKAMVVAFRAPEGDFRDWDEIESWAGEIADALTREVVTS